MTTFTAQDVRRASGLNDVHLHRLVKAGLLKPRKAARAVTVGRGRPARLTYPPQEILIASVVAHLFHNSVESRILHWAAKDLRDQLYDPSTPGHAAYAGAAAGKPWFMFLAKVPAWEKWKVGFAPDYSLLDELPDDAEVMILPLHRLWKEAIATIEGADA